MTNYLKHRVQNELEGVGILSRMSIMQVGPQSFCHECLEYCSSLRFFLWILCKSFVGKCVRQWKLHVQSSRQVNCCLFQTFIALFSVSWLYSRHQTSPDTDKHFWNSHKIITDSDLAGYVSSSLSLEIIDSGFYNHHQDHQDHHNHNHWRPSWLPLAIQAIKKFKEIKQFKENKQFKNSLTHCSFVDLNDVTLALKEANTVQAGKLSKLVQWVAGPWFST